LPLIERGGKFYITPFTNGEAQHDASVLAGVTREASFAFCASGAVRPDTDKPAADVNTTYNPAKPKVKIIDWFADEHLKTLFELDLIEDPKLREILKRVHDAEMLSTDDSFVLGTKYAEATAAYYEEGNAVPELGTYTSKSLNCGGSKVREEATALGALIVTEGVVRKIYPDRKDSKKPLKELRVAIEGCGNAGSYAASLFSEAGATIVAMSDSKAAITNPDGLDVTKVLEIKSQTDSLANCRSLAGVKILQNPEELLELDVDILIPAATQDVITKDIGNAERIKARIIAEAANGPIDAYAADVLYKKGIVRIHDSLASAGGVAVSNDERYQNMRCLGRDPAKFVFFI